MAPEASNVDNDVSPEEFLKRLHQLTSTQEAEDRARAAELEKDILHSREQRRARRAGKTFDPLLPVVKPSPGFSCNNYLLTPTRPRTK